MAHGTLEITFYPSLADLTPAVGIGSGPARYPVTAMYRPPHSLTARRVGGEFVCDSERLLQTGDADPRGYGLSLGQGLFWGDVHALFLRRLASIVHAVRFF